MNIRIAPSLLSADFTRLADEIATIEAGADMLHLDVMDGHFVPNMTIGPMIVKACRSVSKLPFDCHLMISEPQRYIEAFIDAGADMISIHCETEPHLQRALQ
ncbi:MAG TPA: ribulose-phosphate 3-epimerase, partial [Thermoanaerobaculia bacterium]